MKIQHCMIAFALGFGMCQAGIVQAPAGAPAGSTGQCKDGTYSNAAKKTGACRGHKGVQQWFAADTSAAPADSAKTSKKAAAVAAPAPSAAPAPASTAAPAAAPAPRTAKPSSSTSAAPAAPGGGAGMVWVNTPTNVYHCQGSRYYGKTKEGKYMTEAQAKAGGAHPDHGKGCGQ
jgi:Protein of unknown function (DUF3761)